MNISRKADPFLVKKNGRAVDCVREHTLERAFNEAMDKWGPWLRNDDVIEVAAAPVAQKPVVQRPTKHEIQLYGAAQQ